MTQVGGHLRRHQQFVILFVRSVSQGIHQVVKPADTPRNFWGTGASAAIADRIGRVDRQASVFMRMLSYRPYHTC